MLLSSACQLRKDTCHRKLTKDGKQKKIHSSASMTISMTIRREMGKTQQPQECAVTVSASGKQKPRQQPGEWGVVRNLRGAEIRGVQKLEACRNQRWDFYRNFSPFAQLWSTMISRFFLPFYLGQWVLITKVLPLSLFSKGI